jgi:hypothetical protein
MKRPLENDPDNGSAFLCMFLSIIGNIQHYLGLTISEVCNPLV